MEHLANYYSLLLPILLPFFFFTAPATTELYTLSLHDALPISRPLPHGTAHHAAKRLVLRWDRAGDRKSTRLNSSHVSSSYAVFCLKKKIWIVKDCSAVFNQHLLVGATSASVLG